MVDCEYVGCKTRPLRKNMQLHLRENVVEHLALVAENQSKQIDDLRQANSGIELNYQELQMTALKKKQDEQQGRLEQTDRTLGDVDYKVSCIRSQNKSKSFRNNVPNLDKSKKSYRILLLTKVSWQTRRWFKQKKNWVQQLPSKDMRWLSLSDS